MQVPRSLGDVASSGFNNAEECLDIETSEYPMIALKVLDLRVLPIEGNAFYPL